MEVNALHRSVVALIDLDHVLGPQIVQLDLFIVRTAGDTVSQGVKLRLVDHSSMLLICLDGLTRVEVPNVNDLVITRN